MGYNRSNAIAYAHKWAYGRNPSYYNFDNIGGDCTNFVSQCLNAGGAKMNYTRDTGWYYNSLYDRAAAWTGVEYLYTFLMNNKGVGPYASELPIEFAQAGDILQLSYDGQIFGHSLFVVATQPQILIAAHSDNGDNRDNSPYNYYWFKRIRLLHIEGCRG